MDILTIVLLLLLAGGFALSFFQSRVLLDVAVFVILTLVLVGIVT